MVGDGTAILSYAGWSFHSGWIWKWKHSLDQNWMDLYDIDKLPPSDKLEKRCGKGADCSIDARNALFGNSFPTTPSNAQTPQDWAINILPKECRISSQEYFETYYNQDNHILLDMRPKEEYEQASLPNSKNIPIDNLDQHLEAIENLIRIHSKSQKLHPIIVCCQRGNDSQLAVKKIQETLSKKFEKEGINLVVKDIIGGLTSYQKNVDNDFLI